MCMGVMGGNRNHTLAVLRRNDVMNYLKFLIVRSMVIFDEILNSQGRNVLVLVINRR